MTTTETQPQEAQTEGSPTRFKSNETRGGDYETWRRNLRSNPEPEPETEE
jgi:hypothetical protein